MNELRQDEFAGEATLSTSGLGRTCLVGMWTGVCHHWAWRFVLGPVMRSAVATLHHAWMREVCGPVDTGLGFVDLASHSWSQHRNDLEAVLDSSTFGNSSGNSMITPSEACKSHGVA